MVMVSGKWTTQEVFTMRLTSQYGEGRFALVLRWYVTKFLTIEDVRIVFYW